MDLMEEEEEGCSGGGFIYIPRGEDNPMETIHLGVLSMQLSLVLGATMGIKQWTL